MKKTLLNIFLLLVVSAAFAQKPMLPRDADLENRVQKQLSKMTLDEKIGQMVELEINMITYTNPEYDVRNLFGKSEKELDAMIQKAGLGDTFKAKDMYISNPQNPDMTRAMQLYAFSQALNAKDPFKIDEGKLDSVINKYKVGSILNAPRTTAQTPETWNYVVKTIQDASMKGLGIPDVYGLDQMHGTTYTKGGTLFPSAINMAATFNRDLTFKMGEIVAYETRACNVPWIYGPDIDLGRMQAWSRQYEGFGEDVYLDSEMSRAAVRGMQGPDPNHIDK
jgi:beta-glucosidase